VTRDRFRVGQAVTNRTRGLFGSVVLDDGELGAFVCIGVIEEESGEHQWWPYTHVRDAKEWATERLATVENQQEVDDADHSLRTTNRKIEAAALRARIREIEEEGK